MLRVEAFGGLGIRLGADLLPDGRIQRRQQSLLVVLAAAGERGVSRDKLLALLWPENSSDSSRHNLKQTIYRLRVAVGDRDVVLGRSVLRLNPGVVTSDVGDFDAALARSDLAAAVALYRGPVLDGVHLLSSLEWERWVDAERDHYAGLYVRTLNAVAEAREAQGAAEAAAATWRLLAEEEPYSARITLRLMGALRRAGEPAAALRAAAAYASRVREDLGADPDPDVIDLAERIRRERPGARPTLPPPARPAPSTATAECGSGDGSGALPEGATFRTEVGPAPSERLPATGAPLHGKEGVRRPRRRGSVLAAMLLFLAGAALARLGRSGSRLRAAAPSPLPAAVAAGRPGSLAVLPFVDITPARDQAYLCDGITEEVLDALSHVESLHVAGRMAISRYRGRSFDVKKVGRTLAVRDVLEGSVQRVGDRVRIRVWLVDAATGEQSWSEHYDGQARDLFALEDEVARAIAAGVAAHAHAAARPRLPGPAPH